MIQINNFSGGVAESKYQGVQGSYAASKGIDINSEPGILQAAQKLTKDSGATVVDLVLFSFQGTDGNSYFFGDAGKIYKRTSGGTWSVVRTEVARICGAFEFNGYFFWATSNRLFRMLIAGSWLDAAVQVYNFGGSAWSGTLSNVTWTGLEVDANWHQMKVAPTGELLVGNGQYLTSISSTFTVNVQALDLPSDWHVKALSYYRDNAVIGAWKGSVNIDQANIYQWETNASSFQVPVTLNEGGINSISSTGNTAYIQSGIDGALYYYNGADAQLIRRIPGTYTASAYSDTYPDAMAQREGLVLIGHSNASGNPSDHGVWTYGTLFRNLPPILNFTYPISTGNTTNVVIGSIFQTGLDTYVSWKDTTSGTVYGVDKLDYSNKFSGATYETIILGRGRPLRNWTRVAISFEPLPASCSVALSYKADGATSYTAILLPDGSSTYSTSGGTNAYWDLPVTAQQIQYKVTLVTSANTTPRITSITIYDEAGAGD